mgnify:CR=1 FL=1
MSTIDQREQLTFRLADLPQCALLRRVLVADPEHFERMEVTAASPAFADALDGN